MAFQKTISVNLQTPTAEKMLEYVDLFIRYYDEDPTTMTNNQKENFIESKFFKHLKTAVQEQSNKEKIKALTPEDVDGIITPVPEAGQ